MGVSIVSLVEDLHEFSVLWREQPITLIVRPSAVTPLLGRRMREGDGDDGLVDALAAVLVSWSVTDEQGGVTDPNRDLLESLPTVFLAWLTKAVGEELSGKALSLLSASGSPPTVR